MEKIAVIGLGYVGLPLSVALARKFDTLGFDISKRRVDELRQGKDSTHEVTAEVLNDSSLQLSSDDAELAGRTIYIVTVPTPIDDANRPDFKAILSACSLVGPALSPGSVVVFESTVYPGVTEEICGPALEKASGLKCGVDFKLGYSPERINPGDKEHPLEKIIKVVAGQDDETLARLATVYGAIIEAGIHKAQSIKVAEAAKVIENTQRDVNIALMNEISKICDLVGIRSADVLAAAGTKWNFLKFHPGLVGGHCIGVDPYYLTAKAEELIRDGEHPVARWDCFTSELAKTQFRISHHARTAFYQPPLPASKAIRGALGYPAARCRIRGGNATTPFRRSRRARRCACRMLERTSSDQPRLDCIGHYRGRHRNGRPGRRRRRVPR